MDYLNWINLIEKETNEKLKILIDERDEKTKVFLEEFFREGNIQINYFLDFQEVVDKVLKDPLYQIIIFSLSGQEKKSLSLIKQLKEINPIIKIVIVIEYFKDYDMGEYFIAGADEVILKPFTLNEFKARISKLLKEHFLDIKLQKVIIEDPLTTTYNRGYFEKIIREEVYKALRQNYPLSLMMIDLDNFKWYNDNFGHQEGDKLLRTLGKFLQEKVRKKIDKVCRYGGDEFTIILPYTSWKNASVIAERICNGWKEKDLKLVTLSIGIAQLIERGKIEDTISDLIKRVDKAMYEAKKYKGNKWKIDEESIKQFLDEEFQDED